MSAQFSPTQYNSFSNSYDSINDLPISRAIVINVKRILSPYIKGARVLELACGTGFFTRHMLDWGATSIVGVDISQGMINIAQAAASERLDAAKCKFMLADCKEPFDAGHGQFDLIFAAWLLNYNSNQAEATAMFDNISAHLKPGGRFVTVMPHAEEDPMVCINRINLDFAKEYGYHVEYRGPHEPGYYVQLKFDVNPPVEFGNYYLPKSLYENAAREGGMRGKITWEEITLPEDHDEVNSYMVEPVPKGYFDTFLEYPDFRIMTIRKS